MAFPPKQRDVPIADYRYRHEAEFAAGFLEDAGIPFRLQTDDAGGADPFIVSARPARLWVRAEHVEKACELLEIPLDPNYSRGEVDVSGLPRPAPAEVTSDVSGLPRPAPTEVTSDASSLPRPAPTEVTSDASGLPGPAATEATSEGVVQLGHGSARAQASPGSLTSRERVVAGTLSVALLGLGLGATPIVLARAFAVVSVALGVVFGIGAVLGRGVGPLRLALRLLSGDVP